LEIPGEKVVCQGCLAQLKPHEASFCVCCGQFFEVPLEPHLCSSCIENRPPFALHRSCGVYEGVLKELILLFKYRGYEILGKEIAKFADSALAEEEGLWWSLDALVPVPLHPKRERQRGFNQAGIISRELGRFRGIDVLRDSIVEQRNVPPQTFLAGSERKANVAGVFHVAHPERVKGKKLLLLDDVFTTGATLTECSEVLKRAGAEEVRALTIAQAG